MDLSEDEDFWHWWAPDLSSISIMRLTFVVLSEMSATDRWIAEKIGSEIYVLLRMNPNNFDDLLNFRVLFSSQNVNLMSNSIF